MKPKVKSKKPLKIGDDIILNKIGTIIAIDYIEPALCIQFEDGTELWFESKDKDIRKIEVIK